MNAAYQQATGIVESRQPVAVRASSLKVAGGHNCWLADAERVREHSHALDHRTGSAPAATGGRQIELVAPTPKDPGSSRRFPRRRRRDFTGAVQPARRTVDCSGCHRSEFGDAAVAVLRVGRSSTRPISPRCRRSISTIPQHRASSMRLRNESHNCWTQAARPTRPTMQDADRGDGRRRFRSRRSIRALVTSKALTLYDGTVASGGNRYENNVIALYEFKTGQGLDGVRHERCRSRGGSAVLRRRELGRRLGHQVQDVRVEGAGVHDDEPQVPAADRARPASTRSKPGSCPAT